ALPGKYLVLLGNTELIGISRRIEDREEKKRLQDFIKTVKPIGIGFIARTASKGVNQDEIEKEMKYLITIWEEILNKSERMKSPNLLYEEPSLHIRAVRDLITDEVTKIIVDSRKAYKDLKDYMKSNFPETKIQIDLYSDSTPLFIKHDIEPEIEKLLDNRVWLKSGGYLIIEETEALTVIDINSGRYTRGCNQEETIFNINIEAAREVAHQIRLRNLVGIIVIDFIDLKNRQKKEEIFNTFTEELKKDKAHSVIMNMSPFGVVQMTRQRFRESILTSISEPCIYCEGNGYLKSIETTSYEIIRELRRLISNQLIKKIIIVSNPNLISILKEIEGDNLKQFEQQHAVELIFESKDCKLDEFEIKTQ
ncbi:MAG: Rne/Rng family ribonuclease, partial [Thermodesulfobacteriota bacterium]